MKNVKKFVLSAVVIAAVSLVAQGSEAGHRPDRGNVAAGKTVAGSGVFFKGGWGGGQLTDFGSITDMTQTGL